MLQDFILGRRILGLLVDTAPKAEFEPWVTARALIAAHGVHAAFLVTRAAALLTGEGRAADAARLEAVLDAIAVLRKLQSLRPKGSPS
jgi:hypothetical protein